MKEPFKGYRAMKSNIRVILRYASKAKGSRTPMNCSTVIKGPLKTQLCARQLHGAFKSVLGGLEILPATAGGI